jgi:hypothetical protein
MNHAGELFVPVKPAGFTKSHADRPGECRTPKEVARVQAITQLLPKAFDSTRLLLLRTSPTYVLQQR